MEVDSDLSELFVKAQDGFQQMKTQPNGHMSNDDLLRVYSHYKQATLGQPTTQRPSIWDPVGRAKWDAWNSLGTMSREEAMRRYCEIADEITPGWRPAALVAVAALPTTGGTDEVSPQSPAQLNSQSSSVARVLQQPNTMKHLMAAGTWTWLQATAPKVPPESAPLDIPPADEDGKPDNTTKIASPTKNEDEKTDIPSTDEDISPQKNVTLSFPKALSPRFSSATTVTKDIKALQSPTNEAMADEDDWFDWFPFITPFRYLRCCTTREEQVR